MRPGAGTEGDVKQEHGTRYAPPDGTDHLSLSPGLQGGVVNLTTTHVVCHWTKIECWSLPTEALWWAVCFLSCPRQEELSQTRSM